MEFTIIALAITVINCVLGIVTFASNKKREAVQDTKKETKDNHQDLIEYQLKELKEDYKDMSQDIKEIKKMLDAYKETLVAIIKEQIDEHVKIYHSKEK